MDHVIKVKTKPFHRFMVFLATLGTALACIWLFFQGIKFESSYSFYYIAVSLIGIPYGLITFSMSYRAYSKKGLLFSIKPGENGQIMSRKVSVNLKDIRDLQIIQEFKIYKPRTMLFSDLTIQTVQNKIIKIPTYNILSVRDFKYNVENYILPYTTQEAQQNWKKRFGKNNIVTN